MANGGIIGPVVNPTTGTQTQTITAVTSSNPSFSVQPRTTSVDLLIIAGGGGGVGNYPSGSGGGAGGLILYPGYPITSGNFPITIGAGGAGGPAPGGPFRGAVNGNDTIFSGPGGTLTAKAGGRGAVGPAASPPPTGAASPGGSGGGGGGENACATGGTGIQPIQSGGSGTFGFGNRGGNAPSPSPAPRRGNGGGGAGGAGADNSGPGGAGKDVTPLFGVAPQPFYIANVPNTGASAPGVFAGGGAGSQDAPSGGSANGGTGGGGNSAVGGIFNPGANGVANTGGGGGAAHEGAGGNGGSGYVVVKEPAVSYFQASGVWSINDAYNYKKAGNWN
jgi:hypothetical protein